FVKGDVIASLVIIVINIVGGLAIGVGQRGMDALDALKRYGLLTIGDGRVSQIPALVLSTPAGVLGTRPASEEPDPRPASARTWGRRRSRCARRSSPSWGSRSRRRACA